MTGDVGSVCSLLPEERGGFEQAALRSARFHLSSRCCVERVSVSQALVLAPSDDPVRHVTGKTTSYHPLAERKPHEERFRGVNQQTGLIYGMRMRHAWPLERGWARVEVTLPGMPVTGQPSDVAQRRGWLVRRRAASKGWSTKKNHRSSYAASPKLSSISSPSTVVVAGTTASSELPLQSMALALPPFHHHVER